VGVPQIEPATEGELESCPFCEGREGRTPPETLVLPAREPADSPGWTVRVVPNLYPAFERQEVVVHSPRHVRSFAELEDGEIALVAEAWRMRIRTEGPGYVHALVNEGRLAGASLAHSHSQLVWMPEPPPQVVLEAGADVRGALLAGAELVGAETVAAVCAVAGRVPYETLIAPRELDADLGDGLLVLRDVVRRLRAVEGPVPWNAWLHHSVDSWHIELVPRLTVLAGIELGAGVYVNTLAPEEAAGRLRGAPDTGRTTTTNAADNST
jgi:UDPglucose--hexose-1-phosphate uridylyltransferase